MKVPFCLPLINQDVIQEVNDCLTNTGWLTTGPKVIELEKEASKLAGLEHTLCVNSWTSGAMLILKWFGIGQGDEVIIPAYTYSATALCAMNLGTKVVMVDVNEDFNISVTNIKNAITVNTKAIMPVDIGGWPCDYQEIRDLVESNEVRQIFTPSNDRQRHLGRPVVLSDSAHSIGAIYKGKPAAQWGDFTIYSLHSVKNVTAGEGGAICINLPAPFNNKDEYKFLKAFALNGQTKSAFEKNQVGAWRYDIIDQGLKINMPDICAAIALAQIRKYTSSMLPERKKIIEQYNAAFEKYDWAIIPPYKNDIKISSCHLYMLRVKGINEAERDKMIQYISEKGVGVNVHYIPMAMLTLFRNKGYNITDYPKTYDLYQNEITLPVYNGLTAQQIDYVIKIVIDAYESLGINQPSIVNFDIENFTKKHITTRKESLFHRDIEANREKLVNNVTGKQVLVIGGAGTIGSSFIKAILPFFPSKLVVVDYNENGLTELTRDLRSSYNHFIPKDYITYPFDFGGSIFSKYYQKEAFDIVACFAAHKHVRSEKDHLAIEAMVRNNVFNTKNLLDLSVQNPPQHFFSVSTDKAANPVNVMGASKKVMEKVLLSYADKLKITTARFANVAFSNGSLLYGFLERIKKRQPLSAPADVKRYFVSPEESGQLCLLACILGTSSDIFFPKLNESQMMTFSHIAEQFLKELGLEPDYCDTEQEAREKANNWKPSMKKYPVYFFTSDTSGEKPYEEFYDVDDELDMNSYQSLGVVKNSPRHSRSEVASMMEAFERLFAKEQLSKEDIIRLLNDYLPDFQHIETGKSLDEKM